MTRFKCKVCGDKIVSRVILEERAKGMSNPGIARLLTLRGFAVTSSTITGHLKHAIDDNPDPMRSKVGEPFDAPSKPPMVIPAGRDFAIMVRDKAVDLMAQDKFDLLDKEHAPGIAVGLRAQSEINKQVNKTDDRKTALTLAMILSGATGDGPPEALLIDDGTTVEGEFVDLHTEGEDSLPSEE